MTADEPTRIDRMFQLFIHWLGHKTCVGYAISLTDGKTLGITCLACGMTSFNANDVAQKYCGHCRVFHADTLP